MKVSFYSNTQPQFCSNTRVYIAKDGNPVGTYTKLFRNDLEWEKFTDFMVKHFKDKEDVQFIQFASSDGSEAYTQIITLLENHKNIDKFFPIKAYDIDKEICDASKSGLININSIDESKFTQRGIHFDKYFTNTNKELHIKDDTSTNTTLQKYPTKTYKVSKTLTEKVRFENADMFEILRNHQDKSNTVLMCRNVLFFLSDRELDYFTTLAACTLKKGSLFIIGEHDRYQVASSIQSKGFVRVLPNIFVKA